MAYFVVPPEFVPEVSTVVNFVMSFTPLLSYGSTVLSIRKRRSSMGFSIDICATMLVASILRIGYYFNDPFEMALLRQCFVMVFIQTILLHTALKFRSLDEVTFETYSSDWKGQYEILHDVNGELLGEIRDMASTLDTSDVVACAKFAFEQLLRLVYANAVVLGGVSVLLVKSAVRLFDHHYYRPFRFWQWEDAISYWKFLAGFIMTLGLVQAIFNGNEYLGITLGSMSFLVESSLPLPQIMLFQRVKNVDNFKTILLLSWLGGDVTKISYLFFGTNNVGWLFIVAAFFQMSLNLVITYQFFYYMRHPGVSENEGYELPLRGGPRGRATSVDVNGSTVARSISGLIPHNSEVPLVPQHQHFKDTPTGSSSSGDLSEAAEPIPGPQRRMSVDLGQGVVEEFRSRGNTFK